METRHLQLSEFNTLLQTKYILEHAEGDNNINIHKINNNLHRLHITRCTP